MGRSTSTPPAPWRSAWSTTGADLILLSGTTGESPTTHTPEKQELIHQVKDALAGRAMVMAGAGSNDTAHAVRIGVASQEAGAEGLLINAPYYNRPSQEGVYRHINAVVEATDLPVMVYDIPGRTGVKITEDTLARLAENPPRQGRQGRHRRRRAGL